MTITVAVTGGIGAGKSTVSSGLATRGAIVVDSDQLAREVVAPGSAGLTAVVDQFGGGMLNEDGSLNRQALAAVVFADGAALRRLEHITHPLVRARFAELQAAAPSGSVLVNDIPLLTTRSAAAAFHLVIGVGAPVSARIDRLVGRGLTAADATARISVQIDDDSRRPLCNVWIDNSAGPAELRRQVDKVWSRLSGYAANTAAGRGASRPGRRIVPYDPSWPQEATRLIDRIRHLVGARRVDHVGSTAVPGFPAEDVIDLQLSVEGSGQAAELMSVLSGGGFPPAAGMGRGNTHPDAIGQLEPDRGSAAAHVNADPGRSVNLYLRVNNSPGWRWALCLRDWLRSEPGAGADYLVRQERAAADPDRTTADGPGDDRPSALDAVAPQVRRWAESVRWQPS